LLEFGIRNEASWGGALDASWPARRAFARSTSRAPNTRRGSRHNIAFHYDLGNDFYALWLDPALIYSSGLYRDDAISLEDAQAAKLERVTELLRLPSLGADAQVLEIGCGWGALALHLARRHPARVTGLTLSAQQLAHAQTAARRAGLDGAVDLRLQDYRDVRGEFERIVSIEMLEAVGERYWPVYFATLRERLRPGGVAVVQVITIADAHFDKYRRGADFIQRFIFPGGMLPSPGALHAEAERAGLRLHTAELFGTSYAATWSSGGAASCSRGRRSPRSASTTRSGASGITTSATAKPGSAPAGSTSASTRSSTRIRPRACRLLRILSRPRIAAMPTPSCAPPATASPPLRRGPCRRHAGGGAPVPAVHERRSASATGRSTSRRCASACGRAASPWSR
jgi:cyclopropane fatty-acyl-phospholipid synthase-like methyltransferase